MANLKVGAGKQLQEYNTNDGEYSGKTYAFEKNETYNNLKKAGIKEIPITADGKFDEESAKKVLEAREKMLKISEEYEEKKKNSKTTKDLNFFFGEKNWKPTGNGFYTIPKQAINNNEIIIRTNNVRNIGKDLQYVLVVGNNKAVYLKPWQVMGFNHLGNGGYSNQSGVMVKLNRNFFKPYTFKSNFDGMSFAQDDTFDSLVQTAKEQEKKSLQFQFTDKKYKTF